MRSVGRVASVAAVVGGGLTLGVGGLYLDPQPPAPPPSTGPPDEVDLPVGLPELLRRHLDPAGRGRVPDVATLAIVGRATMRPGGQGPPIPLRFRTNHRVGTEFVANIALTWFGRPVVRGIDGFVAGHGISQIGGTVTTGPEADQAASLFLWSEATCVPGVRGRTPGLRAHEEAPDRLRLELPSADGPLAAELTFRDDVPIRFTGDRHKGAGIGLVPWSVDYLGWRRVSGIPIPTVAEVRWWDEPAPWFRVEIVAAVPNADVEAPLAEARQRLQEVTSGTLDLA